MNVKSGYTMMDSGVISPKDNQITFRLGHAPVNPSKTEFFVNTIKYMYGVNYIVAGATLTWLNEFPLDSLDKVRITYWI